MGTTLVSARIPQVKKDASGSILASLGATTSDLINSAFDYLIARGTLPNAEEKNAPTEAMFAKFVDQSTLPITWDDESPLDCKAILREGKRADYDSLA